LRTSRRGCSSAVSAVPQAEQKRASSALSRPHAEQALTVEIVRRGYVRKLRGARARRGKGALA